MKPARLCAYAACPKRCERQIVLTTPAGRPAFCGELHAALYLIDQLRKQAKGPGECGDYWVLGRLDEALDQLLEIERARQEAEKGKAGL